MNEFNHGQLSELIYSVERDIKPAAHMIVKTEYIKDIIKHVNQNTIDIKVIYNIVDELFSEVHIFKYPHLLYIITTTEEGFLEPGKAGIHEIYRHWIQGKLFGYPENIICAFISSYLKEKD